MATQQCVIQALRLLIQNFMSGKKPEIKRQLLDDLFELYEKTFESIPDDFLYDAFAEFCRTNNENFYGSLPPLNTMYKYVVANYSDKEAMLESTELADCLDCEKGLKKLCLHINSVDAFYNPMVTKRLYVYACMECEAGRAQYKTGLKNEKQVEAQIIKQKNIIAAYTTDRHYSHEGSPLLQPESILTEYRKQKSKDLQKTGKPNIYRAAYKRMEQSALIRDQRRAEQGLDPI
tara:strand:+ start:416 stop:1114 length:699 start_codon:yes stop_codon:yes gene_type:complete